MEDTGIRVVLTGDEIRKILTEKMKKAQERADKKLRQLEIDPSDRGLQDRAGRYQKEAGKYEFILAHLTGNLVIFSLNELEQLISPDQRLDY